MKLAWLTDIHLDFLDEDQRQEFYQQINNCGADTILITGDISNASIEGRDVLCDMNDACDRAGQDMLFVLGNHDYYGRGIAKIRKEENNIRIKSRNYLSTGGGVFCKDIAIIGVDGWADCRYGDFEKARKSIELKDHRHIWDFADLGDAANTHYNTTDELVEGIKRRDYAILKKRQEWADIDAQLLDDSLTCAIYGGAIYGWLSFDRIIILTHVPPFPEVCKYKGQPTSDTLLPYYSCKATGDVIMKYVKEHPNKQFLVLCGHTHDKAEWTHPLHPNLTVKAGGAEYHAPEIQEIIEV